MKDIKDRQSKESRFERFIRLYGDGIQVIVFGVIVGAAILSLLTPAGFLEWIITFGSIGAVVALFSLGGGN